MLRKLRKIFFPTIAEKLRKEAKISAYEKFYDQLKYVENMIVLALGDSQKSVSIHVEERYSERILQMFSKYYDCSIRGSTENYNELIINFKESDDALS